MENTAHTPVAQVLVDVGARQVDRTFDYLVPAKLAKAAVVGARVRVRFSGRLVNGFIIALVPESDHAGTLRPIERVLGPAVLTKAISHLTHEVATSFLGTWSDVVRSAVPPRHVEAEKLMANLATIPLVEREQFRNLDLQMLSAELAHYSGGQQLIQRLQEAKSRPTGSSATGSSPGGTRTGGTGSTRVALTLSPGLNAVRIISELALCGRSSGTDPGTTLVLVPDSRTVGRIRLELTDILSNTSATVVVLDAAETPRNRYTAFLQILAGAADIVIGTRDAVFAPIDNLSRIIVWDESSEHYRDQRSPYWHARRVAMMRSADTGCDLILAGYSPSLETMQLVANGWLKAIVRPASLRRQDVASVLTESAAKADEIPGARIPSLVWRQIKAGIRKGPVLVTVPRAGYARFLACHDCEEVLECEKCGGALTQPSATSDLQCGVCATTFPDYLCSNCDSSKFKLISVGATRIVDELRRTFPRISIIESSANQGVVARITDQAQLVVATTGAEPVAAGGYQTTIILDGQFSLIRTELDSGERTIHRWFKLLAMTKPAELGGAMVVTGSQTNRIVQALVRVDPAGWARQELQERTEFGLPPIKRFVSLTAPSLELQEFLALIQADLEQVPGSQVIPGITRVETMRSDEASEARDGMVPEPAPKAAKKGATSTAILSLPTQGSQKTMTLLKTRVYQWFGVVPWEYSQTGIERHELADQLLAIPLGHTQQLRIEVDPPRL